MLKKIRYPGENLSLLLSIIFSLISAFVIYQISIGILIFLFFLQLLFIVFKQKEIQGNSIKISSTQFVNINQIIEESCAQLNMVKPHCYITFDPYINAFVMGFSKPYILVLTSALVESLSESELKFVINHELGHIKMGHSRLKSLVLPSDKDIPFVTFIFNFWLRKTEYTADRVGLLISKNIKDSVNALLKLTVGSNISQKINVKAFITQIEEAYDEHVEKISEWFLTHPYITNRIRQLVEFYKFKIENKNNEKSI